MTWADSDGLCASVRSGNDERVLSRGRSRPTCEVVRDPRLAHQPLRVGHPPGRGHGRCVHRTCRSDRPRDRAPRRSRPPCSACLTALSSLAAHQAAVPRTDDDATPVVVVTKIPLPWYVPRVVVARKFRDAIPEYEAVPGLAYKYFTIADDAKFGGIYLWNSRAQAKAWFNEAWHARVLAQRGAAAQVTMFDAPLVLDN